MGYDDEPLSSEEILRQARDTQPGNELLGDDPAESEVWGAEQYQEMLRDRDQRREGEEKQRSSRPNWYRRLWDRSQPLTVLATTAVIAPVVFLVGFVMSGQGVGDSFAEGVVTESVKTCNDGGCKYLVTTVYSLPATDRFLTHAGHRNSDFPEGSTVRVYYDPEDPEQASYTSAASMRLRGVLVMVGGGLVAVCGVGIAGYLWIERRRDTGSPASRLGRPTPTVSPSPKPGLDSRPQSRKEPIKAASETAIPAALRDRASLMATIAVEGDSGSQIAEKITNVAGHEAKNIGLALTMGDQHLSESEESLIIEALASETENGHLVGAVVQGGPPALILRIGREAAARGWSRWRTTDWITFWTNRSGDDDADSQG